MRFHKASADIFVPDAIRIPEALARTTHLCIAAHQDDIEIMAYHGIAACFRSRERWFTGVVVTNGAGSPRSGIYGNFTDEEMQQVRLIEQRKAAYVGEYACQVQLAFSSGEVKNPREGAVVEDLKQLLRAAQPQIVYLLDDAKQVLPVSARTNIAAALVGVFDSQVSGGKRYDLATAGRRLAHATYYQSHGTDEETALNFAMDLTPLIENPNLPVADYVTGYIERFRADVEKRVTALL
jgi:LmbE family N-acetylglucosaminyl deacetylase